ncbi:MAG: InlB B-repeat-containing protein, partial [Lachnospiraceae bacterium]|nr:InlB B-repeat-containing protein [Lachnospiraceae bacterium]
MNSFKQFIKKNWKRTVSSLILTSLLVGTDGTSLITLSDFERVFADDEVYGIEYVENDTSYNLAITTGNKDTITTSIEYGTKFVNGENIKITPEQGMGIVVYLSADEEIPRDSNGDITGWEEVDNNILPVGNYFLAYEEAGADGGEYSNSYLGFGISVHQATVAAPTEVILAPDGSVTWKQVNTTTTGLELQGNEVTYTVTLYKDNAAVADSTYSTTGLGYNYSSFITGNAYGVYQVYVSAMVTDSDKSGYYIPSASGKSNTSDYSDVIEPNVTDLSVAGENGSRYLTATATDNGTGIAAYAFGPSSTTADGYDSLSWNTVSAEDRVVGKAVTVSSIGQDDFQSSGEYSVFFKDNSGNVARYGAVNVTGLVMHNYNRTVETTGTEERIYLLGDDDSINLNNINPDGRGYVLEGWYAEAGFLNKYNTYLLSDHTDRIAQDVDIYGKWVKQVLSFSTQPANVNITYGGDADGNNKVAVLNAELDASIHGTKTYQWYFKAADSNEFVTVTGAQSTTLNLDQVSQSGEYYIVATVDIGDGSPEIVESDHANVVIGARTLRIKIHNETCDYGQNYEGEFVFEEATEAESAGEGIVSGDTLSSVVNSGSGKIACDYVAGNPAGDYTIYFLTGAEGSESRVDIPYSEISADNYSVVLVGNGTLKVARADLSEAATVVLNDGDSYTYSGLEITPNVTVTYKGTELTKDVDYTVTYDRNVNATTVEKAQVTISYIGNFKGSKTVEFDIVKSGFVTDVVMNKTEWLYGDEYATITPADNKGNGEVTWYYKSRVDGVDFSTDGATTTRPVNAGKYWVYGVISATANYGEIVTNPKAFTINKRTIILTSPTQKWSYDANIHTAATYTQSGDGFVGSDGFQSVSVSGSITDIGNAVNTIDYALTKTTQGKSNNYEIVLKPGTLTVTPTKLDNPASFAWNNTYKGRVSWIAVSRNNLSVEYEIKLYRKDSQGEVSRVKTVTTTETYVDFLDDILNDSKETQYAYAATITVKPVYSAGEKENYVESNESPKTSWRATARINVYPDEFGRLIEICKNDETNGIKVEAPSDASLSYVIFVGQEFKFDAKADTGYAAMGWVYYQNSLENSYFSERFYNHSYWVGSDVTKTYVLELKDTATDPFTVNIKMLSHDRVPNIDSFTASNKTGEDIKNGVSVSFELSDSVGLKSYAIVEVGRAPYDSEWKPITGTPINYVGEDTIDKPGTYTIWVKDTADNTEHVFWNEEDTKQANPYITVYETQFYYGTAIVGDTTEDVAADETGNTMASVYHLKGTSINLPELGFVKSGYAFTNWSGVDAKTGVSTGIYGDGQKLNTNANEKLYAQWTDKSFSYNVEYYYMQTDGKYSSVCDATQSFRAGYNATISVQNAVIQNVQNGFKLDSSKYYSEEDITEEVSEEELLAQNKIRDSITVTEDGQTIKLYYARNQYIITYTYTDTDNTKKTDYATYRYGQSVTVKSMESKKGYDFVGWDFGDLGQAPVTMPAKNLVFTGKYQPKASEYKIVYYLQNIDKGNADKYYLADIYSIDDTLTETIIANHMDAITATVADAPELVGFTCVGVNAKNGSASGILKEGSGSSITGNVYYHDENEENDETLYICYYYDRNVYTATLNVYVDGREGSRIYTKNWKYPYQYDFSDVEKEAFKTYGYSDDDGQNEWIKNWPSGKQLDAYKLASYVDYSTSADGSAPSLMPAGDMTVTREYIIAAQAAYRVEVYYEQKLVEIKDAYGRTNYSLPNHSENRTDQFEKLASFDYYGPIGETVKIGETVNTDGVTISYKYDDNPGDGVDNSYNGIPIYTAYKLGDYYEYSGYYNKMPVFDENGVVTNGGFINAASEGVISDTSEGEEMLVLKVYYERKTTTAEIRYYYADETMSGNDVFNCETVTGKWGTSYVVEPFKYYTNKVKSKSTDDDTYNNGCYIVSYENRYNSTPSSGYSYDSGRYEQEASDTKYNIKNATVKFTEGEDVYNTQVRRFGATIESPAKYSEKSSYSSYNFGSYTYVYYTAADRTKQYYLNVCYRDSANNDSNNISITKTIGDTEYKIRIANKSMIFNYTMTSGDNSNQMYKGAVNFGANIQYEYGEIKEGYEPVEVKLMKLQNKADGTYEIVEDTRTDTYYLRDDYLYIIDDSNQLFRGNYVNYTYNGSASNSTNHRTEYEPGFIIVSKYLEDHPGWYINNRSWNKRFYNTKDGVGGGDLIVNFYYNPTYYTVTYNFRYDSDSDYNKSVNWYKEGTTNIEVTTSRFATANGYEVVWYTDESFETKAPNSIEKIVKNHVFYGRMEKVPLEGHDYISYEYVSEISGIDSAWMTADKLSTCDWTDISESEGAELQTALSANKYAKRQIVVKTKITDAYGREVVFDTPKTEYYYNGTLVLIDQVHYNYSYSDVSLDVLQYARIGFKYDQANTGNKSLAYCTSEGVAMYAFFAREKYTLVIDQNKNELTNNEVSSHLFNVSISIGKITQDGYIFDGWEYYALNDDGSRGDQLTSEYMQEVNYRSATKIAMPDCDVIAVAKWITTEYSNYVTYFYELSDKTYDSARLGLVLEDGVYAKTISLASEQAVSEVTAYYTNSSESELIAVSYDVDVNGEKYTYYFSKLTSESSGYVLDQSNLFAMVREVSFESEKNYKYLDYKTDNTQIFSYSFVTYSCTDKDRNEINVTKKELSDTDSFEAYYNMNLTYYYTRSSNKQIRAVAMSSDGGDAGTTITGTGNCYYGQEITLHASVDTGYTFVGWYAAEDVLVYHEGDVTKKYADTVGDGDEIPLFSLAGYVLKDDWESETAISTETSIQVTVTKSCDYVAVIRPVSVIIPVVTTSGKKDYVYGYEESSDNQVKVSVNWPEGAGSNYVKGYRWYYKYYEVGAVIPDDEAIAELSLDEFTALDEAGSAIHMIPVGKDAGTYIYRCVVDIGRKDNGRDIYVDGNIPVNVAPKKDILATRDTEIDYNGNSYRIVKEYTNTHDLGSYNTSEIYVTESMLEAYDAEYKTGWQEKVLKAYMAIPALTDTNKVEVAAKKSEYQTVIEEFFAELSNRDDKETYYTAEAPSFADVRMYEFKDDKGEIIDRRVIPNIVLWQASTTNKNYQPTQCGAVGVKFNPVYVTITPTSKHFVKVYDGVAQIQGSVDDLDSDYARLTNPANGYYSVDGIVEADKSLQLWLSTDASFNTRHVNAVELVMADIWLGKVEDNEFRYNYNYIFPSGTTIKTSGQITPYPLDITWDESKTHFTYDGVTAWGPEIIKKYLGESGLPSDVDRIEINVENKQVNAGTYNAVATVVQPSGSEGDAGYYYANDYSFSIATCEYTVTSRYLEVKPVATSVVYNGQQQTIIEFEFLTKENEGDEWSSDIFSLPGEQTFSASADSSYTEVGDYLITAQNLIVLLNGKDINDNYIITYGSDYLHIVPCPVVVTGVTVKDKKYDGSVSAEVYTDTNGNAVNHNDEDAYVTFAALSGVKYVATSVDEDGHITAGYYDYSEAVLESGLCAESDILYLVANGITAAFENAAVGDNKNVALTYTNSGTNANGSAGIITGGAKDSYILITEKITGKNSVGIDSVKTATASILASGLTVTVEDVSAVYGETPDYSYTVKGYETGDSSSNVTITGEPVYIIKKVVDDKDESGNVTGSHEVVVFDDGKTIGAGNPLDVGTYKIYVKTATGNIVDGITTGNYDIEWDTQVATLTITPRPVTIKETEVVVRRDYDGTVSVDSTIAPEKNKHYVFSDVENDAESGVLAVDNDTLDLESFTSVYDYKDATIYDESGNYVSGANIVTMSDLVLNSTNYTLVNSVLNVKGEITPKAISVKASDKAITYGDAAPTYTVELAGGSETVKGEEAAVLAPGNYTFTCDYDTEEEGKRGAGTYTIKVSACKNTNYSVTYIDGELTVNKKRIAITPNPQETNYGVKNAGEWNTYLATFGGKFGDGWMYGESAATAGIKYNTDGSGNVVAANAGGTINDFSAEEPVAGNPITYKVVDDNDNPVTATSPVADYKIKAEHVAELDEEGNIVTAYLYSANYEFIPTDGTFKVTYHYITIDGVKVLGKKYDGNCSVAEDHIIKKNITYTYWELGKKHTEKVNEESQFINSLIIKCRYENKNVGSSKKVFVNITLDPDSYLGQRYILLTKDNKAEASENAGIPVDAKVTQTEALAYIVKDGEETYNDALSKRDIYLAPSNVTIKYGEDVTVVADNNVLTSEQAYAAMESNACTSYVYTTNDTSFGWDYDESDNKIYENYSSIGFILESKIYLTTDSSIVYEVGSDVGSYTISIFSSTYDDAGETYKDGLNYQVGRDIGILTVVQNKLATPTPSWDSSSAGTVSWNSVPKIGKVHVQKYVVKLYKDGNLVCSKEIEINTDGRLNSADSHATVSGDEYGSYVYKYDMLDEIHGSGEGNYTATVTAIAATDREINDGNKNVADSDAGITQENGVTASIAAAKVTLVFSTETNTKAATIGSGSYFNFTGKSSNTYTVVAGESGVPIDASWVNANGFSTGYSIGSVIVTGDGYSVDNGQGGTITKKALSISGVSDDSANGKYSAKIGLSSDITSNMNITVTMTLEPRKATLKATIAGTTTGNNAYAQYQQSDIAKTKYGYSDSSTLEYEITCVPEDDNVGSGKYTYTYTWYTYLQGNSKNKAQVAETSNVCKIPEGIKVSNNKYYIECEVVATRKDNGEQTKKTINKPFMIEKYIPSNTDARVDVTGWNYGAARSYYTDTQDKGISYYRYSDEMAFSDYVLIWSTTNNVVTGEGDSKDKLIEGKEWSVEAPKNVGTYYVQVYYKGNANIAPFYSQVTSFDIKKNKLATPGDLKFTSSSTTPYGRLDWSDVTEGTVNASLTENNNLDGNNDKIGVTYQVKLYKKVNNGDAYALVDTGSNYDALTDSSCDMSSYISGKGYYKFEVIAKSSNTDNCEDSAVAQSGEIIVDADVTVTGHTESKDDQYTKVYDGGAITLSIPDGVDSYQWYRNGEAVTGANKHSIDIKYVEQNGIYVCTYTKGGNTFNSHHVEVKILPREITIVSAYDSKNYDGTALVNNKWWIQGQDAAGTVYATGSGTFTDNIVGGGSTSNTVSGVNVIGNANVNVTSVVGLDNALDISGVVIKEGDKVVYNAAMKADNTANYVLSKSEGKLVISKRAINDDKSGEAYIFDVSGITDRTYDGAAQIQEELSVVDTFLKKTLVAYNGKTGADSNASICDYEVTYSQNVYAGTAKITITGLNNYNGEITREFEINPRAIELTADSDSKTYDGNVLTKNGYSISSGELATKSNDVIKSIEIVGTITDQGTTDNTITEGSVKIENKDGVDVTSSYTISLKKGSLRIDPADITITVGDKSCPYNGGAVEYAAADVTVKNNGSNTTITNPGLSYTYYEKSGDGWTELTGAPVNAGEYKVKVNVTAATNYKAGSKEQTFTIAKKHIVLNWNNGTYVYDNTDKSVTAEIDSSSIVTKAGSDAPDDVKISTYQTKGKAYTAGDDADTATGTVYLVTGAVAIGNIARNAGKYVTIVTGITGADADNYCIADDSNNSCDWGIGRADRSITVEGITEVYNGSKHVVSAATTTNLDNSAVIVITYAGKSGASTTEVEGMNVPVNVGEYDATVSIAQTTNYKAANETVTVKVTEKAITEANNSFVITGIEDYKYDGTEKTQSNLKVTDGALNTTLVLGTDYEIEYVNNVNASENGAKVIIKGIGNYNGSVEKTFSISKRNVTLTSATDSKMYDGTALTNENVTVGGDGFVSGEGVTYSFTGTQTDAGSSDNEFTYTLMAGTKAD